MRRKGYQLTRWADDWVITCKSATEAQAAIAAARKILAQLGVQLHPDKTRIVHVQHGFEFLGYKIKLGQGLGLSPDKIRSGTKAGALYAYPREKSIRRFMDQVRARTRRRIPLKTQELIVELNPLVRGWGSITSAHMSASSSTDSMAGLSDVFGRTATGAGAARAGRICPQRAYTGSTDWSTLFS